MGVRGNREKPTYKAVDVLRQYCKDVLMHRRAVRVFPNTYIGMFEVSEAGYLTEIELKLSRSDLFGDVKKSFRKRNWKYKHNDPQAYQTILKYDLIKSGLRCNRFFYLTPKGMVSVDELPVPYAGLIEFTVTEYRGRLYWNFHIVKPAVRLSQEKYGTKWLPKLMESTYFRFHLSRFEKKS